MLIFLIFICLYQLFCLSLYQQIKTLYVMKNNKFPQNFCSYKNIYVDCNTEITFDNQRFSLTQSIKPNLTIKQNFNRLYKAICVVLDIKPKQFQK